VFAERDAGILKDHAGVGPGCLSCVQRAAWIFAKAGQSGGKAMIDRRTLMQAILAGSAATALPGAIGPARAQSKLRIALVVKALGINYFDVTRDGGQEAAKDLGDVELIYTGPTKTTVEDQISVLDPLIAQKVDALVISANDAQALVPTTKKAMRRGITVLSFDSGIAPEGRVMHVNAPNDDLIGAGDIAMMSKTLGGKGEIAILSATSQATNQNIWIGKMKEELKKPEYAGLKLVGVVYGDDIVDKSYREAQGLMSAHPNLRGIISPTAVGIVAASHAVADAHRTGTIFVTGHGLPSEMRQAVEAGISQSFQLWNPADLGYAAVMFAGLIARGKTTGQAGTTADIGHLGPMRVDAGNVAYLKQLLVFDKSNIDRYAKMF
jgi:rhamnose transport system substrate-binding protein